MEKHHQGLGDGTPGALPDAQETQVHYDFLDGLRAVCALYVVILHCVDTVHDYARDKVSRFLQFLLCGPSPVCAFIVLSGFCLMLPVLRTNFRLASGVGQFIQRRATRILPPYYCALFFALALDYKVLSLPTGTHWDLSLPVKGHNLLSHLLLVQNFFPKDIAKINGVLWSISVEWQIYFLFPFLLFLWRSAGLKTFVVVALGVSALVEKLIHAVFGATPHFHFIGLFALGMVAAYLCQNPVGKNPRWRWAVVAACIAYYFSSYSIAASIPEIASGVLTATVLVLTGANRNGLLHRLLAVRPLVSIGTFSYSLYLIHGPILQLLWQYAPLPCRTNPNLLIVLLFVTGIPCSLFAAYIFFLLFERPFLRKAGRKIVHVK